MVDIGSGPIQVTDGTHTSVPMVVNNNKSWSRRIVDFDKARTPMDFMQFYLKPGIESVSRKINRQVCNTVTSANFNSYTSITGGTAVFTRVNLSTAWANLVGGGTPMTPGDVHFVCAPSAYGNMIGDASQNFIQQYIVGESAAVAAQQTARLMPQFGADIDYDQQMPIPAGVTTAALFFNKNAIAMVPVVPQDVDAPQVMTTTYTPEGTGLVYRIQVWYEPSFQAHILHINCMFALTVVRPSYGSYLVCA